LQVRGFAVDVDGTITEPGGRLSLEAAHLLRWLAEQGFYVVLTSGRSVWDLYSLAAYLGLTRVVVGENGGVIALSPVELVVLADKGESLKAYRLLKERIPGVTLRATIPRFTEVVLERTFPLEEGQHLLDEAGIQVVINDTGYAYHLTRRGVDKGKALQQVASHLGVGLEDFVAVGDSVVDIPMFRSCGLGIALANAGEEVKAAASHVVSRPMAEGFIEAIRYVADHHLKARLPGVEAP
jgi:hypothetical protein